MTKRLRILIVDDDGVDREHLRRLLLKADATVEIVEATDLASALLSLADGGGFDCAFLDSRLPDGDGMDLIGRFAKASTVIFLSGTDDKAIEKEAFLRGAKIYLGKGTLNLQSLRQSLALIGDETVMR